MGLLLSADLSPVELWNHLCGAIVNSAAKAAFWPIIEWLRAAIVRSVPNTHSVLVVPKPSVPLPDALLLKHRHRLLLSHLHVLNPSINRTARTRIAETVGEVSVDLRETRLENKRVRDKKENRSAT